MCRYKVRSVREDRWSGRRSKSPACLANGIDERAAGSDGRAPTRRAAGSAIGSLGQPILILAPGERTCKRAYRQAWGEASRNAVYVDAMFATGHEAGEPGHLPREPEDAPIFVGRALRDQKDVDRRPRD